MTGKQHIAVGIVSSILGAWGLQAVGVPIMPEASLVVGVLVAAAGALAPDIDHPKSLISRRLPGKFLRRGLPLLAVAVVLGLLPLIIGEIPGIAGVLGSAANRLGVTIAVTLLAVGLGLKAVSLVVTALSRHRGATHSLLFTVAVIIGALWLCSGLGVSAWYGCFFGWGWLSHLVADALTEMGLPELFWPFAHS